MKRNLFFISDGTGISVETLGKSLMTQFEGIELNMFTIRYVNTLEKAQQAVAQINQSPSEQGRPIVFSTIVDKSIRMALQQANAFYLDFFQNFITPLEAELSIQASGTPGLSHAVLNDDSYNLRMDAVNFSLNYDDGVSTRGYASADIILLGISRSGKTPTCLYMALQYGLRAANYPLTEEDIQPPRLPKGLEPFRKQLFGLSISPERLHQIRNKRRPNSQYAALEQCQREIEQVEILYKKENIPYINSTHLSVEELSTQIIGSSGLRPKL